VFEITAADIRVYYGIRLTWHRKGTDCEIEPIMMAKKLKKLPCDLKLV